MTNILAGSNRTYQQCPRKEAARYETIISLHGQLFGKCLPADKQYWTMCSVHTNADGSFAQASELGQLLSSGMLSANQFHGVDIVSDIIEKNKIAKPDANWICNDFVHAMKRSAVSSGFNPAVINADFVCMNKKAARTVSDILELVTYLDIKDVMVASNVMYNNPYANNSFDAIELDPDITLREYLKHNVFKLAWSKGGWNVHPECYYYGGTGENSKTLMATTVFYRK